MNSGLSETGLSETGLPFGEVGVADSSSFNNAPVPAGPLLDYEAALDWLDSHIDLERLLGSPEAKVPTLDRMRTLMGVLGDPQDSVEAIHITGTNGKGSTARFAVALLGACGVVAGGYTSPHIERVNDRITLSNEPLDDESFTQAISEIAVFEPIVVDRCGERPNYFEVLAAAAYNWFASTAHVNVVEVGMGGRWDATNVVDAAVAVITNIDADHLEIIGPTLADVAAEKAGIISRGATVVCGETAPDLVEVVAGVAADNKAELWRRGNDWDVVARQPAVGGQLVTVRTPYGTHSDCFVPLHGAHQAINAASAVCCVEAFFGRCLDDELVTAALADVALPARFEIVAQRPTVVIDGAHNPAGAAALRATLAETLSIGAGSIGAGSIGAGSIGAGSIGASAVVGSDDAGPTRPEPANVLVLGVNKPHDPAAFCEALDLGAFDSPFDVVVTTSASWPRAMSPKEVAEAVERATTGRRRPLEIVPVADVCDALQWAKERADAQGTVVVSGSLYVAATARRLLGGRSH